jgi:DNA-binding transcriptional MerR regulator
VDMSGLLTIGQVARKAGLRPSAIRYYEKSELLPKPARTGGQRRYDASVLSRLAVLQHAKECGLSLQEARGLFNDHGRPSERWRRIARTKIAELDAAIERLTVMRDKLQRSCRCSDLEECGHRMVEARNREAAQDYCEENGSE